MWIGLQQQRETTCECRDDTSLCEACHSTWSWHDGTPMGWWQWAHHEPDDVGRCGRLNYADWVEAECSNTLYYICEKGLWWCYVAVQVLDNFLEHFHVDKFVTSK